MTKYYYHVRMHGVVHDCRSILFDVCRGVCGLSRSKPTNLFVLYAPERQVYSLLSHARFLGHFVLEVLLRFARHD